MFARMPRYAPAASGIRSATRMRATGQNGSSRHMLVLYNSSSRRISEQVSELLIRGFGVQVPGGAPSLTWGFIVPGHFYMSVLSPWLLRGCSRARTQQSGLVKNGPPGARCGGIRPGTAPSRTAGAAPGRLGQWSRPSARAPGVCPSPRYRCRHAQCNLLVNGTRMVDTSVALTPQTGRLPAGDTRDSGNVLPSGGAGYSDARSG
jgi:hypothetical protein